MNVIFEMYIQGPNTVVEKAEAVLRVTAIARIDIDRLDVPLFCIRWTLNTVNAEYCCSGSPNLFRSTTTGQLNEVTEVLDVDIRGLNKFIRYESVICSFSNSSPVFTSMFQRLFLSCEMKR